MTIYDISGYVIETMNDNSSYLHYQGMKIPIDPTSLIKKHIDQYLNNCHHFATLFERAFSDGTSIDNSFGSSPEEDNLLKYIPQDFRSEVNYNNLSKPERFDYLINFFLVAFNKCMEIAPPLKMQDVSPFIQNCKNYQY